MFNQSLKIQEAKSEHGEKYQKHPKIYVLDAQNISVFDCLIEFRERILSMPFTGLKFDQYLDENVVYGVG